METELLPPVEIPFETLSTEAQLGVIDAFIFREGTDYGFHEATHEKKQQDIRRQIEQRKVKLVFDPNEESVTLMTEREWQATRSGAARG
jgi:uncharacterized protein YheU (UPF0270 family)